MSSASTEFATARKMGIYDPLHQMNMWKETFRPPFTTATTDHAVTGPVHSVSVIKPKVDYSHAQSFQSHGETSKPPDLKNSHVSQQSQRRLTQNREAARKSRLRKKAYVLQLELSRLKLSQLEQELERLKQASLLQGADVGLSGTLSNAGMAKFEVEYARWVEVQQEQILELRNATQNQTADVELRILVDMALNHYDNLFLMKGDAAKADVFYLMCGMWRTPAERFFLWIGGFRPSELLNVLMPQIEPVTEQQHLSISKLRQSSEQAEDALTKGIDRLQQTISRSIAAQPMGEGCYLAQVAKEFEKLDALENFLNQADHLRQQALQHMSRILSTRQAALGLLALGEYFHRFRALSALWAARPPGHC